MDSLLTKIDRYITLLSQMGRAGRGGQPSVCIFLHGKQQRLPKEMRPAFKGDRPVCLRRALVNIFRLTDIDGQLDIDAFWQ